MNKMEKIIEISKIICRKDLYPRFELNQEIIERYSGSIEYLPPIKINQDNILIDGFHRVKAHQLAEIKEIKAEIINTESEKELIKLAYQWNSYHGLQLKKEEKQKFAMEMIGIMTVQEIAIVLSTDDRTIERWTTAQREALEKEQERIIIEHYLRAENTQEKIAEMLELPRQTITDKIKNFAEKRQMSEIGKTFEPLLYNIWNIQKDSKTTRFGHFPQVFMENLIYYHTELFDVIYDPFAGYGTTIDVCKKWYRRYYCSDLVVMAGREDDIKERSIQQGIPKELKKPDLVFLDPPYWKQAKNKYSKLDSDLSNMGLEDFYKTFETFLKELIRWKVQRIAIIIAPTQYPNKNHEFEDHIFKFNQILSSKYQIEMRCVIPYSTEQYNGTQVEIMKKEKKPLNLIRDLVIWALKKE